MSVPVKNTDRASRSVDLSDGRSIEPGGFGDAPDDDTTADLIANGRLTKVLHRTGPHEDSDEHEPVEPKKRASARQQKES